LREHLEKKKAAEQPASEQFRLEKPAPTTTPPAPGPKPLKAASTPDPEAKVPEVAIPTGKAEATELPATTAPIPVDIEISPDEEAELLRDTDVGLPDDMDMETVYHNVFHDPTTPPRHE